MLKINYEKNNEYKQIYIDKIYPELKIIELLNDKTITKIFIQKERQ